MKESLGYIISSIAVITALSYLTGWAYHRAYLSTLGFEWLIHQYPSRSFLQSSWYILASLAAGGIIFVFSADQVTVYRPSNVMLISLIAMAIVPIAFFLILKPGAAAAAGASVVNWLAALSIFGMLISFDTSIGKTLDPKYHLALKAAFLIAIIFLAFYNLPKHVGRLNARLDNSIHDTSLNKVTLKDPAKSSDNYRLVFDNGNKLYLLKLKEGTYPEMVIINHDEVSSILSDEYKPPPKNKKKSEKPV